MATNYLTGGSRMAAGVQARVLQCGYDTVEISTFNLATNTPSSSSGLAINDVISFLQLESNPSIINNGPVISAVALDVPALDSSTGVVTAVGDGQVSSSFVARYISGATIGRSSAGGIQGANVGGTIGYAPFSSSFNTYTTPSLSFYTVTMKVTTGPSGTATTTGTIALKVAYTVDP